MRYKVVVTFTESLLGTAPLDPEVYTSYIGSRAADGITPADELASSSIEEALEKGTTGFHRVGGQPILYDYMLKGFCKDACGMLARADGTESKKLKAYKKVIDGLLFVTPRQIPIRVVGEIGFLERPLRAQTAQGERVALARSESIPAGSSIEFEIATLGAIPESLLMEWLDYGALRGLGQWRNGGWGSFRYVISTL